MRIAVVGSGYVGLVTGACLATKGHQVTCVDLDQQKVDQLRAGDVPIFEPGLDALIADGTAANRLTFTTDLDAAVGVAEVVFIAVGTPPRSSDGHADLSFVYAAAKQIGVAVKRFTVVVTKSTVPVGTGDEIERIIREVNPGADFSVASNPEFLREGNAIHDFLHPDRIVIGVADSHAGEVLSRLYDREGFGQAPIMIHSRRTAELSKYAANAFLAMKVAFINEIADLCEQTGIDVEDVAIAIGSDSRIGPKFLRAGPGFGGSCFPKDMLALVKTAQDFDSPLRLVETTLSVNEQRRRAMGRKVIAACGGSVRGKLVSVLGLTFKAGTDDVREAPALAIIQTLKDAGATVAAFDPRGMQKAREYLRGVRLAVDPYDAANGADCVAIATEWPEFREIDLDRLRRAMRVPLIVDLRNLLSLGHRGLQKFDYVGVGRASRDRPTPQIGQAAE